MQIKYLPNHQITETKKNLTCIYFLGCLATAGALSCGLWSFRTGRKVLSQNMMRLRIVAQGFTITALVLGVMSTGKTIK